jgi:hypothetical protein
MNPSKTNPPNHACAITRSTGHTHAATAPATNNTAAKPPPRSVGSVWLER